MRMYLLVKALRLTTLRCQREARLLFLRTAAERPTYARLLAVAMADRSSAQTSRLWQRIGTVAASTCPKRPQVTAESMRSLAHLLRIKRQECALDQHKFSGRFADTRS